MKKSILLLLSIVLLSSCNSIKVATDYDESVDFSKYTTYAFYMPVIDKAEISDLDKKRILNAIEKELFIKGFTKSNNPDMLICVFSKSRVKATVSRGNMVNSWGWNQYWGYQGNDINVTQYKEGTLFVDFIDTEKKELVWQGIGTGALRQQSKAKKEARIKEFVKEIISKFPKDKNSEV